MKQPVQMDVRHPRLYAFLNNKALNVMSLLVITFLMMMSASIDSGGWLMPTVGAVTATLLFAGYAIWLWIKKPQKVVIDTWLSDVNSYFVFYFICIATFQPSSIWWYVPVMPAAVAVIFISLIRPASHVEFTVGRTSQSSQSSQNRGSVA